MSKADGLEPQVVFMAQLIEAIAHRIKNPTPLVNPLEQEQQPTNNFCANHGYTNTNIAASSTPISDNGASILGAAPAAPPAARAGLRARRRRGDLGAAVDPGVRSVAERLHPVLIPMPTSPALPLPHPQALAYLS